MATTLAEAFEPWYRVSTWHSYHPKDDERFHRCCYQFFQVQGARADAEEFREQLREAIPRRGGGAWLSSHEEALERQSANFDAIFAYLHDTGQIGQ